MYKLMSDFLLREEVGIIAVEGQSPQELVILDNLEPGLGVDLISEQDNATVSNETASNETVVPEANQTANASEEAVSPAKMTEADLLFYLQNLTRASYENYFTVYGADYRLYLLENQLRLAKKYLRFMLDQQMLKHEEMDVMRHNQKLIQWAIIDHNQRLDALEGGNATVPGNETIPAGNETRDANATIPAGNDTVVMDEGV